MALWRGELRGSHRSVALESIRSVYFRRPTGFAFPAEMTDGEQRFSAREARRGFGGLLMSLPCLWLNHPFRVADAEYKPFQLTIGAECGLNIPRTVITNDPTAAEECIAHLGTPVIYKTLASASVADGSKVSFVYATEVSASDVADARVSLTAHQFQQRLSKARDVRATVVGNRVFAADIISEGSPQRRLDWRADYASLRYEKTELPTAVEAALLKMLRRLGLVFAAADFVVTTDDQYFFVDLNPNGQWGWIEEKTGLPIAAAIADVLMEGQNEELCGIGPI